MTANEFLAWERGQTTKHFYVGGEVFAMSGGSFRHNRLGAQMIASLVRGAASGSCGVFSSDQKVGLPGDTFVYADAVVLCSPIETRPGTSDVATNPVAVVEVLSKSTESYDRGDKQKGYLALTSLHHFLLVSQTEQRIELYTRQDDGSFRYESFGSGATLKLTRLSIELSADELYAGVFELPGD